MPYGGYRQKTSFKDVDDLTCPDYEEFSSVSRCLHISDVEDGQRRRMLVPQPIRNSSALSSHTRVLWFAPTQSMEKHNFYGNVSYVINWKTVLDEMGPHLYSIDQAIYADHAFTRILLTKMNYDGRLHKVHLKSDGSAIQKRSCKYFHAATCYCKSRTGHHELQIGIEVTEKDAKWLYKHCTVMANNHKLANERMIQQITRNDGTIKEYAPFKCFLYNTTLNTLCPYQNSRSKIEETLTSMNIAFSRSLPLVDDMETDKRNINHNNRLYPSRDIGAISPNKITPKTRPLSPLVIGRVIPSTSQLKTRPNYAPVYNDDGLTVWRPKISISDSEQFSQLFPSTTWTTIDFSSVDRTVYPPRPNKSPPTARTTAVPTAGSGTLGRSVGRQHGNICPVTTEPSYIARPSYRTPYDETEQPEESFTERLRHVFMHCCRLLFTKNWKSLSKRHILCFLALCFITKRYSPKRYILALLKPHERAFALHP